MMTHVSLPLLAIAVAGLAACTGPSVEGFHFEVTALGTVDECNEPTVAYQKTIDVVLVFPEQSSYTELYTDNALFATGSIAGCDIDYESVVWGEERDGYPIKWQLTGHATFRYGGSACNLEAGIDWQGEETFTIVSTEHPDVPYGCRYILETEGRYRPDAG